MINGDYRHILQDKCRNMIKNFEIYIKALERAWHDYELSEDERALLGTLRESLGISQEQHDLFEIQILCYFFRDTFDKQVECIVA